MGKIGEKERFIIDSPLSPLSPFLLYNLSLSHFPPFPLFPLLHFIWVNSYDFIPKTSLELAKLPGEITG